MIKYPIRLTGPGVTVCMIIQIAWFVNKPCAEPIMADFEINATSLTAWQTILANQEQEWWKYQFKNTGVI